MKLTNAEKIRFSSFASSFDRFSMPPMLLPIAHSLHIPLSHVAAAAGVYYLIYGIMQPLWGMVSNRIGLAAIIKWCTLAGSIATLSAVFVNNVLTLTIARGIAGGCFSASVPAALIYVGSTRDEKTRHKGITDLMTGTALGTALSTLVCGAVSAWAGWRWGFVVSSAVAVAAFFTVLNVEELPKISFKDPFISPLVKLFKNLSFYRLMFLSALDGAAILGAITFIPASVESRGSNTAVAAAITAVYGFTVLFAAKIVGALSSRYSRSQFILWGGLTGTAACLLLTLSHHLVSAFLGCSLLGICWAAMHTSLQTWATEVAPAQRSLAVSFFAASLFVGSSVTSSLNGKVIGRHQYDLIFTRATICLLIVSLLGSWLRIRYENRMAAPTTS